MSTTNINFFATLLIGEQEVPLASEIVSGESDSQDGVNNGFIFKLNRGPSDPPVTVYLGDVIAFIEQQLGAGIGILAGNKNMKSISAAFPSLSSSNFTSANQTLVNIYEFTLNSSTKETLFSFNLAVEGSDPTQGLIPLPSAMTGWLNIQSLSISFSTSTSAEESGEQQLQQVQQSF